MIFPHLSVAIDAAISEILEVSLFEMPKIEANLIKEQKGSVKPGQRTLKRRLQHA